MVTTSKRIFTLHMQLLNSVLCSPLLLITNFTIGSGRELQCLYYREFDTIEILSRGFISQSIYFFVRITDITEDYSMDD